MASRIETDIPSGIDERLGVEIIACDGIELAYIIRARQSASKTTFLTSPACNFQIGFVVYPKLGTIKRHAHRPLSRQLVGTSEFILVRSGLCEIEVYSDAKEHIATRQLLPGDIVVMVAGGHGFRTAEDTVLLELKQGPYTGMDEKVHF